MPSPVSPAAGEHRLRRAGQGLSLPKINHVHLTPTLPAPESNRPPPPDDQQPVGFDGDFGPFSTNHGLHQIL